MKVLILSIASEVDEVKHGGWCSNVHITDVLCYQICNKYVYNKYQVGHNRHGQISISAVKLGLCLNCQCLELMQRNEVCMQDFHLLLTTYK